MGCREGNIHKALIMLEKKGIWIIQCSDLIETPPWGGTIQENFLNAAVKAQTQYSPFKLLDCLKIIEKKLDRKKSFINGPRPIDLDILFYDSIFVNTPRLVIPHPRLWERAFVIKPLRQICPEIVRYPDYVHC